MTAFALLGFVAVAPLAHAFMPAAHVVVMEATRAKLPADSPIRLAMDAQPGVAAAGAVGPDLGYLSNRGLLAAVDLGYAPWGDRFHYHLVGTFAATQLRAALASGDQSQIAWAAGWLTHVTGDMACHGLYVNPEAGVWLAARDDPKHGKEKMRLHATLEEWAEPYVWIAVGQHPEDSYSPEGLGRAFCSKERLPSGPFHQAALKVYGDAPQGGGDADLKSWYGRLLTGLSSPLGTRVSLGYTYTPYAEAQTRLDATRRSRLEQACSTAAERAAALLNAAQNGDYSAFSDAWNLDIGDDGRPVSSLTVAIHTADNTGAGTDATVLFGMATDDGHSAQWSLDNANHNDFERDRTDEFYLYLEDKGFDPRRLAKVWIEMGARSGPAPDWKCDALRVWVNGERREYKVDKWFTSKARRWEAEVTAKGK